MAATLTFLLISSLLEGALCGRFNIKMPKKINVLNGSCVTIPCSFDVASKYENNLDDTCKAYWSDSPSFKSQHAKLKPTKDMTGDLTKKDCTTTFNHTSFLRSTKYYFRLGCGDTLKYSFLPTGVYVSFIDHPPSPTLTPSKLEVKEGTSVSVTCSAPAPCWSHPPALTWTPNLGQSQETLQENQDKTKVKTSVVSFTASHLHHGNKISCTAVYRKQDGSPDVTAETSLTPVVSYLPKNITVSVSASGPVPENSNVSLTCSSNANPAVRNYTWYKADGDQETFIGTGMHLNIKVIRDRRTFFCKAENVIGVGHSNLAQLEIQFHPQILFSSDCVKTASQVNCSCDADGNPSPAVQWYLNGVAVNQSGGFEIFSETLNITVRRSFFILSQPQVKHLSTLLCRSVNSLGSASQQFCMSKLKSSAEHQGSFLYPVIISTLVVLLLVLMCVLLFFIRALKNQRKPKVGLTGENITFAMSQLLTEEGNEATNTTEESIYANTDGLREADTLHPTTIAETSSTNLPSSEPASAEAGSKNSENKGDKCEVIYSSVKTKSKKKKEATSLNMNSPGSSYLEEEKCMVEGINRNFVSNALQMGVLYDEVGPKNVKKEVECEYAQVKFKDKSDMQK